MQCCCCDGIVITVRMGGAQPLTLLFLSLCWCLSHMQERLRPQFPLGTPTAYQALAEACWQDDWMGRWVP
jgi:hypothetical protein